MSSIDEEMLLDEQENQREVAFIRERLPLELKEQFTDGQLLWMIDALVDYYVDSGILDTDDDEVDIDMEETARHIAEQAKAEGIGSFDERDVYFIVEADLDFQEENL
ncbi:MAG: hypothetical protein J6M25_08135 [Prevotella sp.]|nr:hypothetical protein [Prevotella sp.]